MLVLGIDIGTTSICGLLADADSGDVVKTLTVDGSPFLPDSEPFARVQSVHIISERVDGLISELMSPDICAIGFTGQMHGILYLDKSGTPLSPLYTWQDGRGNQLSGIEGHGGKKLTYAEVLHGASGFGCVTDLYNEKNGLIPEGAVGFCTIHDYEAMRICGLASPLVHISDAASFGCYDVKHKRFKLKNVRLPRVTSDFEIIGDYRGVPVCCAIGDNQASFLGSCGEGVGALVNIGTGSQISIFCAGVPDKTSLEVRPLTADSYILVGSALCGGRAFSLAARFIASCAALAGDEGKVNIYSRIDEALAEPRATDMKFDTRFDGTRADPRIRAAITNISPDNFTPEDMLTACMYGIAEELRALAGRELQEGAVIAGSGNGLRKNPAMRRIAAYVFGGKLRIPACREEAAFGAALTALIASGVKTAAQARALVQYEEL